MSLVGKLYGTFVVEGSLSDSTETVLLVRHRADSSSSGGVVKTVVLPRSDSLQPGVMAARRLDAIALQDRVASDWPEVAPILDRPTTREQLREVLASGEAWFVTHRYDSSLQKLLTELGTTALDGEGIWLICRTVARGALAFQQVDPGTGRRSHGNLKLSNVLIRGLPVRQGQSEIVVTDPAPGGRSDQTPAERQELLRDFERDDLEALGRMLFQMVAGRPLPDSTDWHGVWEWPDGKLPRWKKLFGNDAKNWQQLCRELIEVRRTPGTLSLASVEKRLAQMVPREPRVNRSVFAIAGGAILLLGTILLLVFGRTKGARLRVEASIAPVDLFYSPSDDPSKKKKVPQESSEGGSTVFAFKLAPGRYLIEGIPGGEYRLIAPVLTNIQIKAGEERTLPLLFDFARLQLASEPAGAEVTWRSGNQKQTLGRTPLKVVLPPDDRFEESQFYFQANGFTRKTVQMQLLPGTNITFSATLSRPQLGTVTTEFISLIDQGSFRKTSFFLNDEEKTAEIVEVVPDKPYSLKILPPPPWAEIQTNITFAAEPPHQPFTNAPPFGTLLLSNRDMDTRGARVWLLFGGEQCNLGPLGYERFKLPPGNFKLSIELDGYVTTNFPVVISNGTVTKVPIAMDRASASP